MLTSLSPFGAARTAAPAIGDKAIAGLPPLGSRISEFDLWRPGYAGAVVEVVIAGTTSLAPLYSDPGLTVPISNPVALLTLTDANGGTYGKFAGPIYTYVPYRLFVDQGNETGIERPPLISLAGTDASQALATSARGAYPVAVQSYLDRDVDATLYGALSAAVGSEVCAATLDAAIGAAASAGGGRVLLPAIQIPFTNLTLPQGVVLRGKGKGATVLVSTQTGIPAIVLGGDGSGLECLTLDGIDLGPQSVGLQGIGTALPTLDEVVIKRFETGVRFRGIVNALWRDFTVSNCSNGLDIRGDLDAAGSSTGSEVSNLRWDGGEVSLCTNYGLSLLFFDASVRDCCFQSIVFASNSGDALRLKGTRGHRFQDCQWATNISNLKISDGDNIAFLSLNTVERIRFISGRMNTGSMTFNQTCLDVQFNGMELLGTSGVLSVPENPIIFADCIENGQVTFTGDLTKLVQRNSSSAIGVFAGVTTDATPTAAWERVLAPGEAILVTAKIIARQRDGTNVGIFWEMGGAYRPGATLPFQSATGTFTVGLVVTGQTSGASARIVANSQTGANGTLTIRDIVGTFIVGEIVADSSSGSGRFQGALGFSDAVMDGLGTTAVRTPETTGIAVSVAVAILGALVQVLVTGTAAKTVEWTAEISTLSP